MELQILFTKEQPKYVSIYEQIKGKIIQQQLLADEKLPSKRKLADQLNVSIQTVQIAYEQLISEGYIYSVERSGYYISAYSGDWKQDVHPTSPSTEITETQPKFNLRNGQVDADAFPYNIWLKLYRKQLNTQPIHNSNWQGEQSLRIEIARYIQTARDIVCNPDQIFIYSGTQQQLQALCTFFGKVPIATENPGFFRATTIFEQNKYPIEYVQVDEYGATIPVTPCKLYYVTPAHQYPLGHIMPVERKIQLLQWARDAECYIIEDDYDAEFRYKGLPIPPLAQLDQLQQVIYFGTFSKTLIPSIRVSYMILPASLAKQFQAFNRYQKATVSKIDQLVIANFLATGYYSKHIEKMRTLYRKKRQLLIQSLQTYLPQEFNIIGAAAGLHLIVQLPPWLTEKPAVQLALDEGIAIDPVSTCYQINIPQNAVMIGFGAIPLKEIPSAIQLLAKSWLNAKECM